MEMWLMKRGNINWIVQSSHNSLRQFLWKYSTEEMDRWKTDISQKENDQINRKWFEEIARRAKNREECYLNSLIISNGW